VTRCLFYAVFAASACNRCLGFTNAQRTCQLRITVFLHQHNHLLLLCQDPANGREALIEAALDEAEGADMLMVKPGRLHSC
jgi:hypothetical protein